jgi:mRNA interferase RelE/StbE
VTFQIEITPEGVRHFDRLPGKIRDAALEAIFGTIADNPHRASKSLRGELEGLHSARRGDFRIIYEIRDDEIVVLVHRIQHRKDVYRGR